jgi:hypothetical protein
MIGIANEISALQQTYGAAAHSLVLLASYLFSIGLYYSAVSVSQDSSLRKMVRKSMTDLVDHIGTAQMQKDIEKNVMKVVEYNKKRNGGTDWHISLNDRSKYQRIFTASNRRTTKEIMIQNINDQTAWPAYYSFVKAKNQKYNAISNMASFDIKAR